MSTMSIVAPGRSSRGKAPRGRAARESGISRTGAMLIMAVFTVYFPVSYTHLTLPTTPYV